MPHAAISFGNPSLKVVQNTSTFLRWVFEDVLEITVLKPDCHERDSSWSCCQRIVPHCRTGQWLEDIKTLGNSCADKQTQSGWWLQMAEAVRRQPWILLLSKPASACRRCLRQLQVTLHAAIYMHSWSLFSAPAKLCSWQMEAHAKLPLSCVGQQLGNVGSVEHCVKCFSSRSLSGQGEEGMGWGREGSGCAVKGLAFTANEKKAPVASPDPNALIG